MSLFNELKRRNVIRVATAYVVVSWLVIQVVDSILPVFEAPLWVTKAILLVLAVGFPIALLFSWAFEMTPGGVKKTAEVDADESITHNTGKKLNYIIIGALVLIIGGLLVERTVMSPTTVEKSAEAPIASIAVLPFADMSKDSDQEYFSDGISEEILNVLAKVPGLHITSRSSAFSFKGKDIDIREVAAKLGVNHVLEGSVRKSGSTVRITAQLIEASSDKHLWSETYDRNLDDIFAVQDEISAAIVAALKVTLNIEAPAPTKTVAINPEAYDLYLHGLRSFQLDTFESFDVALTAFNDALTLEPDFALAKIYKAHTLLKQVLTGSKANVGQIDGAIALLDVVLAKNPNNSDAHNVMARLRGFRGHRDAATFHATEAYRLNPNNADNISSYISVSADKMDKEEIKALFRKAQQLDPLNAEILYDYAGALMSTLHEYKAAETAFFKAMELAPNNGTYPFNLHMLYTRHMGNIRDAIPLLHQSDAADTEDPDSLKYLSESYVALGDYETALAYADQALALNPVNGDSLKSKIMTLHYLGRTQEAMALLEKTIADPNTFYRRISKRDFLFLQRTFYIAVGEPKKAEASLLKHFPKITDLLDLPPPASPRELGGGLEIADFAAIYYHLGDVEKARQMADRLALLDEVFFRESDGYVLTRNYLNLAYITAMRGNTEKSIEHLTTMYERGLVENWRNNILLAPYLVSIREHPKYIVLIARIEADMARQLQQVRAWEAKQ